MATATPNNYTTLGFTFHPSNMPFLVTRQEYKTKNPIQGGMYLVTAAIVFDTSDPKTPRVLLLQRSPMDTMPNKWEIPGGGCDDEDPSILHAVARELWEEAGLKTKHIGAMIGEPHVFPTKHGGICKFNFVVQVETDDGGRVEPKIDLEEHQRVLWISEEELRAKRVGDVEFELTSKLLEGALLQAFEEVGKKGEDGP